MTQSVWRVANPTPIPERPDFEGILEQGIEVLPVRITIVQEGVLTGWDDGALGFEDDAIWFSGRAASFCLSPADLLPEAPPLLFALKSDLPELRLRHPVRKVVVRLFVEPREDGDLEEDQKHLLREVARLRRASATFESEYPPLAPRPGMVSLHGARLTPTRRIVFAAAFLTVALLWHDPFAFVVFCALAVLVGAWGLGDSDQPVLRRIAREEAVGAQSPNASEGGG